MMHLRRGRHFRRYPTSFFRPLRPMRPDTILNADCALMERRILMTSHCVPTPPALLLPLISHPDLPSPALHLCSARTACPRYSLLPLPPGVLATTGCCTHDIRHPTRSSTTSSSASLVLLFVSRCFYSSMSISNIVYIHVYLPQS